MQKMSPINGNQINWNHVFYFSIVATVGSIKNAAPKLHISSSTLSEHILQLERDLNIRLFHRHHRKMTLTDEGTRLFHYAKQMFETGQRLIDVVSPIPLGCYPISIGLVPSPSIPVAYRLICKYVTKFGPMNMRFYHTTQDELEKGLVEAKFDFGFSSRQPERKNIMDARISLSSLGFFVAEKLCNEKFMDLLKSLPLLICNSEPRLYSAVQQYLEQADITPASIMNADYPSLLIELCQGGMGIGVFSVDSISEMRFEPKREIVKIKDSPEISERHFVLWSKDGENSEAVKRMKECLK